MAATTVSRTEAARVFQQAIDKTIRENGEVGMQVAVYHNGQPVVDVWEGIADETTGREVDGETLFPSFSVIKAATATALHIQALGSVASFHLRGVPLCCSTEREVEERRYDEFQGEPI
jgi:hypothetical protein